MGDAKKRGTFEQRQSESVAREQERVRSLPTIVRATRGGVSALMLAVAAITAGSTLHPHTLQPKDPTK